VSPLVRGRLRRREHDEGGSPAEGEVVEIDADELSGVFAAPQWLRDLGVASWLLVGVAALLAGAVWLASLTQTIVVPVLVAAIIAAVAGPLVDALERRGLPRSLGAALVFLVIVLIGVAMGLMILGGITSEAANVTSKLQDGADEIAGWLKDAGVDPGKAEGAKDDVSASVSDGFHALLTGLGKGISALAGLAVFLSFTALSLFFLLKDSPQIGAFVRRHMGVPEPVAQTISSRTVASLRGYFAGVTIVAAWSALLVGIGALLLGVPLAGTIAAVTFLGGYVPYLGAWAAGVFAVLIALGDGGTSTAVALAVIVLLANGVLQQLVQPVAFGATLGIHPLAVLIVTIAGGALFGTIGLILAAPLTAAAVKISADLARARERDDEAVGQPGAGAGPSAPSSHQAPEPGPA
jgi:putative heme transporter